MHKTYCEVKRDVYMTTCQQSSCSRKWRRRDSDCIQHLNCCLHICTCFTYYYVMLLLHLLRHNTYCAASIRGCFTCIALLVYVVALLALLVQMNKIMWQQVHRTKDDCVKFKAEFTGDGSKQTFMDSMTYQSMNAVTNQPKKWCAICGGLVARTFHIERAKWVDTVTHLYSYSILE
jgi:hypothetical protein